MTDAAKRALEPCPFCGGEAEIDESPSRIHDYKFKFHAGCSNDVCIAYCLTDGFETRKEAAEAWNARAPVEAVPQGWQTMESAPRANGYILGINMRGKEAGEAFVMRNTFTPSEEYTHAHPEACWQEKGRDWPCYPTHWMPLPAPPNAILNSAAKPPMPEEVKEAVEAAQALIEQDALGLTKYGMSALETLIREVERKYQP